MKTIPFSWRWAEDADGKFVPLRLGCKYTWGKQGQLWTVTEEWPGNQHILELVDLNNDNIIRRRDNFGDEASNKDPANLNRKAGGSLQWDGDVNGDGPLVGNKTPIGEANVCANRPNSYMD